MSDPKQKLESETIVSRPIPTGGIQKDSTTVARGAVIQPSDPNYPPYLLLIKLVDDGDNMAHIDGPHTSADLDLGQATTKVGVRVTHNPTAEGPNLNVIIERR